MTELHDAIKENFGQLSSSEIATLSSYFHNERLAKNDFFTRTNQYCKRLSLVKSGLLRIYNISNDKEITQWISTPGYFVTEISGFLFDQPNKWNIQALTEVELLTINKER